MAENAAKHMENICIARDEAGEFRRLLKSQDLETEAWQGLNIQEVEEKQCRDCCPSALHKKKRGKVEEDKDDEKEERRKEEELKENREKEGEEAGKKMQGEMVEKVTKVERKRQRSLNLKKRKRDGEEQEEEDDEKNGNISA
ncbi:hypothetical protein AOLI_G00079980 [Acnodon oligacanthus]